ncbi:Elastase [Plakobranchus ocellatus]|uniref:Elastase n=1 Tax=Plakobranchus ocellatus TaxID=259542 RepID=A0AAV4AEL2_9GAST|nr:Elastase [Plakobranchus ocellatus]
MLQPNRDQSGGINEAFSDMAGEAAEEFLFGRSDWVSGAEMYVAPNKALRYFDDPTKDGVSIKHVRNYRKGLDVHYSSGIYNHVFYKLGTTFGIR